MLTAIKRGKKNGQSKCRQKQTQRSHNKPPKEDSSVKNWEWEHKNYRYTPCTSVFGMCHKKSATDITVQKCVKAPKAYLMKSSVESWRSGYILLRRWFTQTWEALVQLDNWTNPWEKYNSWHNNLELHTKAARLVMNQGAHSKENGLSESLCWISIIWFTQNNPQSKKPRLKIPEQVFSVTAPSPNTWEQLKKLWNG
jgi:hypothetical protein